MSLRRKQLGAEGEAIAASYLEERGYHIVARNYRCELGEIDLVALLGDKIHFVEVKMREDFDFGRAIESITPAKKSHIRRTARRMLEENAAWRVYLPFFAVVAIDREKDGTTTIEFLPDAFQ